jgi:hypothetical protein
MDNKNKNERKELKLELFWYNVLLGVSGLATALKISWMLVKYKEIPFGKMVWKLAIILTASLSFLIYYFIGRRKIVRKIEKLGSLKEKKTNKESSTKCVKCRKQTSGRRDTLCPLCYEMVFYQSRFFCFKCKEIYPDKEECPNCHILLGKEEDQISPSRTNS